MSNIIEFKDIKPKSAYENNDFYKNYFKSLEELKGRRNYIEIEARITGIKDFLGNRLDIPTEVIEELAEGIEEKTSLEYEFAIREIAKKYIKGESVL